MTVNSMTDGILGLMLESAFHRKWTLADFERLVLPPLSLGQFALWIDRAQPIGYASWAFLTEEAAAGYRDQTRKLQFEDWNAGDQLWVIDVVCPFGGVLPMMRGLKEHFPAERTEAFWIRHKDNWRLRRYGRPDNAPAHVAYEWPSYVAPGLH